MSIEQRGSGESSKERVPSAGVLFDAMIGAGKRSLGADNPHSQKSYFDEALEYAIKVRTAPLEQQYEVKKRLDLMTMPYNFTEPVPIDPIGLEVVKRLFPMADAAIAQNIAQNQVKIVPRK